MPHELPTPISQDVGIGETKVELACVALVSSFKMLSPGDERSATQQVDLQAIIANDSGLQVAGANIAMSSILVLSLPFMLPTVNSAA